MRKRSWLFCLCLVTGLAGAVEPGNTVQPWTLADQHDVSYTLDDQVRVLLVARDMDAAKLMKTAMQGKPQGYLEARRIVFLADIEGMPAIVSRMFAIPAMRKYSYRVMLDRDGVVVSRYGTKENQLLWLQLDQGKVVEAVSFDSAETLKKALEAVEA